MSVHGGECECARGRVRVGGVCTRVSVCPFQEMPSVRPVHNRNPLSTSPGWEEALQPEEDEESEPDVSAALQMGLGAALAGELSGDGVRVRARASV